MVSLNKRIVESFDGKIKKGGANDLMGQMIDLLKDAPDGFRNSAEYKPARALHTMGMHNSESLNHTTAKSGLEDMKTSIEMAKKALVRYIDKNK